mgnify:CR=1 FL=1
MPTLIDGHNLIGQLSHIALDDPDDERKLVQFLNRLCIQTRRGISVFFDAGPANAAHSAAPVRSTHWVRVQFAPGKADDALVKFLQRQHDRVNYLVVTSDAGLAGRIRQLGARVISADQFLQAMAAPLSAAPEPGKDPEVSLAPDQVEEWLTLFDSKKGQGPR